MKTFTTHVPTRRPRQRRWFVPETSSGVLMLIAAALALGWANSPWRAGYVALSEITVGPASLHLDLSLATWAADGLLAVFFFVVGVELKHEIVAGSLRRPREAAVPVLAAVGGMLVPALIFVTVVSATGEPSALRGWAIPTATDIAFALAVLAIFGRGLPRALRTFLLTLAVVDDLLAIVVIAVFYTEGIDVVALGVAVGVIALFALVVRSRHPFWWLLVPLALVAWGFMHASGVHATIAGVLLGFCVPARAVHGEPVARTESIDEAVRPLSSGFALPLFAFFAAGVSLVDGEGPLGVLAQPVVLAIVAGLVIGKLVGVLGVTALVTKVTPLRLPDAIGLRDLLPVGFLTGMGFTVSLLLAELSFPDDSEHSSGAKAAILIGTVVSATLAAVALRWDARKARNHDMNDDGVPDIDTAVIGDGESAPAVGDALLEEQHRKQPSAQSRHDPDDEGREHPGDKAADREPAGEERRDQQCDEGGDEPDPAEERGCMAARHLENERGEHALRDREHRDREEEPGCGERHVRLQHRPGGQKAHRSGYEKDRGTDEKADHRLLQPPWHRVSTLEST